jgi:hypothetical protein
MSNLSDPPAASLDDEPAVVAADGHK